MQKHIFFGIGGLVIGLAIGFFAANSINRNAASSESTSQIPTNALFAGQQPQNPLGGMQPEVAQALETAKNELSNFEAQLKAGRMYEQIGNSEKAKEYFDKAAPLTPGTFKGNIDMANAYFDVKQFETAGKFYEKALEINPKDIDARTDLGTTYIESTNPDFDRGIAAFNESLRIDPKHEPTLFNLAIAYLRKGDLEDARRTASKLEATNPSSPLIAKLKQRLSSK